MLLHTEIDTLLDLKMGCEIVAVSAGPIPMDKITHLSEFPKAELIAEYRDESGDICSEVLTLPYPAPVTIEVLNDIKAALRDAQPSFDLAASFDRALNVFHHARYNERWDYRTTDIRNVLDHVRVEA